jgi:choline dehydrogenase-like flavoprotein
MTTTPQQFLDNATRTFGQGRAVGGSTIMNGLCWTRSAAADYDAWANLGNPGWGWTDLLPYFLKARKVVPCDFDSFYNQQALSTYR